MQTGRFLVGIIAGLVFALAIVGSANLYSSNSASQSQKGALPAFNASQTQESVTSSSISTATAQSASTSTATSTRTIAPPTPQTPEGGYVANASTSSTATSTASTSSVGSSSASSPDQATFSPTAAPPAGASYSPANIRTLESQPAQSLFVLIPIFAALFFGLLFYRTTLVRE